MITEGELYFFNVIKDDCEVVFDVGVQEDIYFVEIAPELEYHLFEPNLQFCKEINTKLERYTKYINANVKVNKFGLGDKTEARIYYPDTQSFFFRTVHTQSNPELAVVFNIKSFKEYIKENDIKNIDFMKIDIEGGEPDILIPNATFIKKHVKFLQFEYASTWYDRPDLCNYNLGDIYDLYHSEFDFYVLYNSTHPISHSWPNMMTYITNESIPEIENYVNNQYGFEIAMIRK
jgi:FkbM family methyltransferase